MILVFGGTTEGRRVVEALEEAGTRYYYSTRGREMGETPLVNGIHLTGGMDVPQMTACCREHGIRIIIDAAHPFAEELHRNLLLAAGQVGVPVIRYDRIYPKHDNDLIWCKDFNDAARQLEEKGVDSLLALTGVNSIGRLKPFWEKHEKCWFRILNRQASLRVAQANGFPDERLVYYETDETARLIEQLHPEAIITKESGLSGGFTEKVETARRAGVKVFVVERPEYPPHTPDEGKVRIEYVNGPYGLRRAVERLLPEFYPLHSGLTTGTCATAAAVAAILQKGLNVASSQREELPKEVPVILPNGETIHVPVSYFNGYASCFKEAGDDPDITNGIEVRVSVRESDKFEIVGGEGVGTITLPGFDYPPGSPAINKGPRQMICHNIKSILHTVTPPHQQITVSVPNGAEIAKKTFNPRLGIEGGISIIGVSGIVKPFSEEAFVDSIRKCMTIAKASGTERVVINSGGKSERFVKALYPDLPGQAFVEYGNYVGETLKTANELDIKKVTLGVMLGKAVKLAAGHLDTHSRKTTMDIGFIQKMLKQAGIAIDISDITLARELWERIPAERLQPFCDVVISHCQTHCVPLLPKGELTILLIGDDGTIYSQSQEHPQGQ